MKNLSNKINARLYSNQYLKYILKTCYFLSKYPTDFDENVLICLVMAVVAVKTSCRFPTCLLNY